MKRNKWFTNYTALRPRSTRTQFFRLEDFKESSVLDVGCNSGDMSAFAAENGAAHVVGLDYDCAAIQQARTLDHPRCTFVTSDADNPLTWIGLPGPFDVVMCLSFIGTKELEDPQAIISRACGLTRNVFYLEGHNNDGYAKYIRLLFTSGSFTQVECLGLTKDNPKMDPLAKGRPFIRASRNVVPGNQAASHICALLQRRAVGSNKVSIIVVIGRGGAGKSTIRRAVVDRLSEGNQVPGNQGPKFDQIVAGVRVIDDTLALTDVRADQLTLVFDFCALERLAKINLFPDVIYHVRRRDLRSRVMCNHQREPPSSNMDRCKALYSIQT